MILTCPDCATSYFVDDERIPPQGRTVKCASCGARWRAGPEAPVPEPEPEPAPVAAPADDVVAEETEAPAAEDAVDAADDIEIIEAPRRPRPAAAREPQRKGRGGLVAGLSLAASLVVAAGAGVLFRDEVVRLVPQTARAYALAGLPAGREGLVIEQVKTQAAFQGGRPVLSVTGAILNTRDRTVTAPAIKISVLDKAGKPLTAKLARPLNAAIPAGARRYFAIAITDPPAGSRALQVAFEAAPPSATAELAPADAAPAPVEAQPLPSSSPDALPTHG